MAATKLLKAEDLYEIEAEDGCTYELVRGELVRVTPPGGWHGEVSVETTWHLRTYLSDHPIGRMYTETGFILARDPDIVRGPDVAFVREERLPPPEERGGFLPLAPDLAVEVISPWDRSAEVHEKVLEYLAAGTRLVWVVHPRGRTVTVYRPDGSARVLREGDELDGEDVLPGFRLPVAAIFR